MPSTIDLSPERRIESLNSSLINCLAIHQGAATIKHGIEMDNNWHEFVPTHFIYCFFAFNMLYNIDWEKSLNEGHTCEHSKEQIIRRGKSIYAEKSEHDKRSALLKFCFQDRDFSNAYRPFFVEYVTRQFSYEQIVDSLKGIRIDISRHGNIYDSKYVERFRYALEDLMTRDCFDQEHMETVIEFVGKVRNNIFHGIKTARDMKRDDQRERLDIFSSIIIAVNQMPFSYLEFLKNREDFSRHLERLSSELG